MSVRDPARRVRAGPPRRVAGDCRARTAALPPNRIDEPGAVDEASSPGPSPGAIAARTSAYTNC